MAAPVITDPRLIMPSEEDFEKLLTAKLSYEAKRNTPDEVAWTKAHFNETPWGISYNVSIGKYNKSMAAYKRSNKGNAPQPKVETALKYFIVAVAIDWQELIDQLKRTLRNWGFSSANLQNIAKNVWLNDVQNIANVCDRVTVTKLIEKLAANEVSIKLSEAVEKHSKLNSKLFTKEELLKDRVRDKMLEIVDEFLADLKEQDIKIKVDDILLIGSNASYNYTKHSDIDLHILANTKATNYSVEVGNALYSAYRSLFNKQLDIKIFDIPLELFVETEDSARMSNGVYSVKKNKWIKKPTHEEIPEYDKDALNKLVDKWESKCKELINDIKADKLKDELKVVKLLEDIYEKLRKKGIAKSEYAIENLAFKELRNKGYLDKLKEYRNKLVSKRLSLTERMSQQNRRAAYDQIARIAGTQPIIQDNGMFFIYNLKVGDVHRIVRDLERLEIIENVHAFDNGKYDFSRMPIDQVPSKYYDIRGYLKTE